MLRSSPLDPVVDTPGRNYRAVLTAPTGLNPALLAATLPLLLKLPRTGPGRTEGPGLRTACPLRGTGQPPLPYMPISSNAVQAWIPLESGWIPRYSTQVDPTLGGPPQGLRRG